RKELPLLQAHVVVKQPADLPERLGPDLASSELHGQAGRQRVEAHVLAEHALGHPWQGAVRTDEERQHLLLLFPEVDDGLGSVEREEGSGRPASPLGVAPRRPAEGERLRQRVLMIMRERDQARMALHRGPQRLRGRSRSAARSLRRPAECPHAAFDGGEAVLRIVLKSGASVEVDATWNPGSEPIVPGSKLRGKSMEILPAPEAAYRLLHLNWDEVAAIVELPGDARSSTPSGSSSP